MFRCLSIAMVALLLANQEVAHGHESSAAPPPDRDAHAVPVTMVVTKKGLVLADAHGKTLYYFDHDDSGNRSNCDGICAEKWPPLSADKSATASGDFTVIVRTDGSKMWAYRYRPLYTSKNDEVPGDTNGSDPLNLWHIARPAY